jgi:hypothetical protein
MEQGKDKKKKKARGESISHIPERNQQNLILAVSIM